ncbi:MAG TPA: 23S rRNA (uracil(1939)-C(5))-methyltransferase RlmD [Lentimicrobium sp.]|nr:23S rRNA (uracil(1939)-C(5))-methyltransferase RlmD [Lentimicrobium sp.]
MRRKKDRLDPFIIENVEILDAGAEGNAIAKHNDMVIFVPFVVPGDVCDVRIVSKKRRFLEGRAIKFHKLSDKRTQPLCQHFEVCGGCKWQNMEYAEQLFYKQKQVVDAFSRIGHLEYPPMEAILPSPEIYYYRNKLEYTFSAFRWLTADEIGEETEIVNREALGFHIPGMFDKVLDIQTCYLQPEPTNAIRNGLREFAKSKGYSFYNIRKFEGDLRNVIVRNAGDDLMVIMVFGVENPEIVEDVMNYLSSEFQQITSLYYVINLKHNDTISDLQPILYKGRPFITGKMEDLQFRIGPLSFYQTNARQAETMYKLTREFAALSGNETVYDLYTGTGTIANFVARNAKKVIGIEYVEAAVEDARLNSELNNISNTTFFAGDMAKVLTADFIQQNGKPDVLITDPPRAGMHEKVVLSIIEAAPERVVYVSCNPSTQARDIALMSDKYSIVKTQPVDMFPHTHHVENICLLQRKVEN